MVYIAFQNRKSGLLLSGTDFSYSPPRHRYAAESRAPLLLCADDAMAVALEAIRRNITPRMFRIVTLTIRESETDEALRARIVDAWEIFKRQRGR